MKLNCCFGQQVSNFYLFIFIIWVCWIVVLIVVLCQLVLFEMGGHINGMTCFTPIWTDIYLM